MLISRSNFINASRCDTVRYASSTPQQFEAVRKKIHFSGKNNYLSIDNFGSEYELKDARIKKIEALECRLYSKNDTKNFLEKCFSNIHYPEKVKNLFSSCNELPNENELPELEIHQVDLPNAVIGSSRGRRKTMEDTHVATTIEVTLAGKKEEVMITGVFDGRDGKECAAYAAKNLASTLQEYLEIFNFDELTDAGVVNAFSMALVHLSQGYNRKNVGTSFNEDAGATANVMLRIGKDLYLANVGDSRAIMLDADGKVFPLSKDVGPNEPRYTLRKEEGISFLFYFNPEKYGRIASGGALGQHYANGIISSRPEIVKIQNFTGGTLIQCCDGITDVASSSEIGELYHVEKAKGLTNKEICLTLLKTAYGAQSKDNLSIIIQSLD